jgi:hypothetical protein
MASFPGNRAAGITGAYPIAIHGATSAEGANSVDAHTSNYRCGE